MAQDLAAEGAELPAIMQAGRWKSPEMPARYAERMIAGWGRWRNSMSDGGTNLSDLTCRAPCVALFVPLNRGASVGY